MRIGMSAQLLQYADCLMEDRAVLLLCHFHQKPRGRILPVEHDVPAVFRLSSVHQNRNRCDLRNRIKHILKRILISVDKAYHTSILSTMPFMGLCSIFPIPICQKNGDPYYMITGCTFLRRHRKEECRWQRKQNRTADRGNGTKKRTKQGFLTAGSIALGSAVSLPCHSHRNSGNGTKSIAHLRRYGGIKQLGGNIEKTKHKSRNRRTAF